MLKLIAFFRRFRVFLVFIILQIVALTSYFSVMSFPRTRFFNTSNSISGTMLSWESNLSSYLNLEAVNQQLQEENARLQRKLNSNYISIDSTPKTIKDSSRSLVFTYTPATVINSSTKYINNYFTIDAGSLRGIKRDMGVISPNGVVGIVYDVSNHFAVVKSILTSNINISAYIEEEGVSGILKHQTDNPKTVTLTGVSNDYKIKIGAQVRAKGSLGYFPPGKIIGSVIRVEPIEGEPMWNIIVQLKQDMRTLRKVYVIHNIYQQELDSIQQITKE